MVTFTPQPHNYNNTYSKTVALLIVAADSVFKYGTLSPLARTARDEKI
jgi:hypothetical protein